MIWRVLLAFVLALLVGNAAAGLASGLAGGLALAATTVLCALAEILRIQSLNMLHNKKSSDLEIDTFIIARLREKVNAPRAFFADIFAFYFVFAHCG